MAMRCRYVTTSRMPWQALPVPGAAGPWHLSPPSRRGSDAPMTPATYGTGLRTAGTRRQTRLQLRSKRVGLRRSGERSHRRKAGSQVERPDSRRPRSAVADPLLPFGSHRRTLPMRRELAIGIPQPTSRHGPTPSPGRATDCLRCSAVRRRRSLQALAPTPRGRGIRRACAGRSGSDMSCNVRSVAINVAGRSAPSRLTNLARSSVRT